MFRRRSGRGDKRKCRLHSISPFFSIYITIEGTEGLTLVPLHYEEGYMEMGNCVVREIHLSIGGSTPWFESLGDIIACR